MCVIERKTLSDYIHSITDKRSKEQVLRLKAFRYKQMETHKKNMLIVYLVENDNLILSKDDRETMMNSIVNKVVRDNFVLYQSKGINDTIDFIKTIKRKIDEFIIPITASHTTPTDTTEYVVCDDNSQDSSSYLKSIKIHKKDNLTPYNCYILQLSQISGVSIDIAKRIATQYCSFKKLIEAYNCLCDIDKKAHMLADIKANEKRRIGNVLSRRIYEYIIQET